MIYDMVTKVKSTSIDKRVLFNNFSVSLSIRIASRALMLLNFHVAHLSVRTCEQWQYG